jgi:ferredoxin--NADP+ reductase
VTSIIGGRSKEWVIYEEELRAAGDVIVCTDDGSYGRPGFVTEALKDLCEAGGIDEVFAVGPGADDAGLLRADPPVSAIKTTVSLNSIMIDGTGMCGGCRVSIDGKTSTPAATAPSSTATRSTSASWPID